MGYRGSEGVAMAQAAASVQDRARLRAGWLRQASSGESLLHPSNLSMYVVRLF